MLKGGPAALYERGLCSIFPQEWGKSQLLIGKVGHPAGSEGSPKCPIPVFGVPGFPKKGPNLSITELTRLNH